MPPADEGAVRRLRELEERVRQLQEENEHLAERQADTALLGLVSEHLHLESEPDGILRVALEQASVLKDVPLCAVGALGPDALVVRHAYLARSSARLEGQALRLGARVAEELLSGAVALDGEACAAAGLTAGALGGLEARGALLIPFACRSLPRGAFLFADDRP
ncbi:MAG: hypothetical protein NDI82_04230, partial [Anaeromyxobacteraceae bacterium]|nr:hypothetical protein [Anaeromyxobacteraceae bacterium]